MFVRLFLPQGGTLDTVVDLLPGREWTLELPISGHPITVRVEKESGDLPKDCWIAVQFALSEGWSTQLYADLDESGSADIELGAASELAITVLADGKNRPVALSTDWVSVSPHDDTVIISLGDRSTRRVRVLGHDDAPLAGATVTLVRLDDQSEWFEYGETNEDGIYHAPDFGDAPIRAMVSHASVTAVDLELETAGDEYVLRLDATSEIRVFLSDQGVLVPGAQIDLMGASSQYRFMVARTQADGLFTWPSVSSSSNAVVVVSDSRLWSGRTRVKPGSGTHTIDVRRTGSLEFRSRSEPQSFAVDALSSEFDTRVADWIDQGLVSSNRGLMTASATEPLRVNGIPHGEFTWTATSTSGLESSGTVTVEPRKVAIVYVD
jgi:hypothetical protein